MSSLSMTSWVTSSFGPLMCVTTETRHLDRAGQLGECVQDSNTDCR